ncbi:MAG: acyl-ACP--UDP-N-acetylglucosamine O-acyltransferase [Pseudomonadota bacterium]|jgi:UDP-N-acetylglucosamine acyltransferase
MATQVHPTALIERGAELDEGVEVGPYAIIGPDVRVGRDTRIGPHCVVRGHTVLGAGNRVFQFCSIGEEPQDKKYRGEPTRLVIGDRNTFREYVTINCGTVQDAGLTTVGDDNWVMAYVHIAHDCVVGNHVILANCTQLAGHVRIEDHAILGGFTGVHQFCSIGAHAITSVGSVVLQDIAPYVMAAGSPASPRGINSEGLKRRGFDAATVQAIKRAYRALYRSGVALEDARAQIDAMAVEVPAVARFGEFIARARRGLAR